MKSKQPRGSEFVCTIWVYSAQCVCCICPLTNFYFVMMLCTRKRKLCSTYSLLKWRGILWRRLACTFALLLTHHIKDSEQRGGLLKLFSPTFWMMIKHGQNTERLRGWWSRWKRREMKASGGECANRKQSCHRVYRSKIASVYFSEGLSISGHINTHEYMCLQCNPHRHTDVHLHRSLVKYGPGWNEWLSLRDSGRSLLCISLARQ